MQRLPPESLPLGGRRPSQAGGTLSDGPALASVGTMIKVQVSVPLGHRDWQAPAGRRSCGPGRAQ